MKHGRSAEDIIFDILSLVLSLFIGVCFIVLALESGDREDIFKIIFILGGLLNFLLGARNYRKYPQFSVGLTAVAVVLMLCAFT